MAGGFSNGEVPGQSPLHDVKYPAGGMAARGKLGSRQEHGAALKDARSRDQRAFKERGAR